MARIVDKFVMQLETQLADRNVVIELSEGVRQWLARKGFDPLFGARPLARVIQDHVKKPLAEELLFGKLAKGGIVGVDVKDDAPTFSFRAAETAAKRREGKGGNAKRDTPELVE